MIVVYMASSYFHCEMAMSDAGAAGRVASTTIFGIFRSWQRWRHDCCWCRAECASWKPNCTVCMHCFAISIPQWKTVFFSLQYFIILLPNDLLMYRVERLF